LSEPALFLPREAGDPEEKAQSLQALSRAVAVLEVVAAHAQQGCRLTEVIEETELGRATSHRFLKSLQALGLIELEERSGRYFPGVRLAALGIAAINRYGLAQRAAPRMRRLAELSGDTVYLNVRVEDEALCLAREEGSFPIKTLTTRPGDRRPLGVGAGGLALMAFLPADELDAVMRQVGPAATAYGLDAAALVAIVDISRRLGYALNDGSLIPGMTGIGIPVRDSDGRPFAALSVAAITGRMTEPRRTSIVGWLREEAAQLERDLGPLLGPVTAHGRASILSPKSS
jgi:DNA-binding IclR family transcriptional regulator